MFKKLIIFALLFSSLSFMPLHASEQIKLQSQTAVLMDAKTGQVLYNKNMNEKKEPASITKVMTALLALENKKPTDKVTMSEDAVFNIVPGSANIALQPGEILTLEQLLYALGISSANEASNMIGEFVAGSNDEFVKMMNTRAKQLGALNTNFVNANGLNDKNHFTTAYDMALITRQALTIPGYTKYFDSVSYKIPPTNKQPEQRYLYNKNDFVNHQKKYDGIVMSKTGWTTSSRYTLVSVAKRGDKELIAVVMDSKFEQDKFNDSIKLFDYGFDQFSKITYPSNELDQKITLDNQGKPFKTKLVQDQPITVLADKDLKKSDLKLEYYTKPNDTKFPDVYLKISSDKMQYPLLGEFKIQTDNLTPVQKFWQQSKHWLIGILVVVFIIIGLIVGAITFRNHQIKKRRLKRIKQKKLVYQQRQMNKSDQLMHEIDIYQTDDQKKE